MIVTCTAVKEISTKNSHLIFHFFALNFQKYFTSIEFDKLFRHIRS